jgi:hypothetical protein
MDVRPKIFLSYASEDRLKAKLIYDFLMENGFEPWMDFVNILGGRDWNKEIIRAIGQAHFFIRPLAKVI